MHRYTAGMRYTTNSSGRLGQEVRVTLSVSFFPGSFTARIEDRDAQSIHELFNRRFNFQSRDSPVDLLARDKWRSWWFDRFTGVAHLQCPRITGVPTEINMTLICSWEPAFAVVEFQLGDTFYQLACRPPRGVSAWSRVRVTDLGSTAREEDLDRNPPNEQARGSNDPPPEEAPPV